MNAGRLASCLITIERVRRNHASAGSPIFAKNGHGGSAFIGATFMDSSFFHWLLRCACLRKPSKTQLPTCCSSYLGTEK
jgi:K+-transporting ATPase c subunit